MRDMILSWLSLYITKSDFNTWFGVETIFVFHMWLGVGRSEAFKMVFGFLSGLFLGKWVGVGSMNGEFEDLSIGNKF